MQRTLGFILKTTVASSYPITIVHWKEKGFFLNLEQVQRVTSKWTLKHSGWRNRIMLIAQASVTCLLLNQSSPAGVNNWSKGSLPIFVNKVFVLEHRIHSFSAACGCYNPKIAELSSCTEVIWPTKSAILTFWGLYKKFANSRSVLAYLGCRTKL